MKIIITKIDAVPLAIGIQQILLDMQKKGNDPRFPVNYFEQILMDNHKVSKESAELVTEKIINTGILRWELGENCFVL